MKITVKNVKVAEFASEETLCFEATVYIDGVRAFTAHNDGHGGCDMYRAVSPEGAKLLDKAEEWAKSQPEIESDVGGGRMFKYQPDLEHFVGAAVTDYRLEKAIKRKKKKGLMFAENDKIYTVKIPNNHPQAAIFKAKKPNAKFLNDMPLGQALEIYKNLVPVG